MGMSKLWFRSPDPQIRQAGGGDGSGHGRRQPGHGDPERDDGVAGAPPHAPPLLDAAPS